MKPALFALALSLLPLLAASADEEQLTFAGDTYVAGQNVAVGTPVDRDAFVAGFDTRLGGPVQGDAHIAGFNVNADQPVGGDLYAAGFSVIVGQSVGGDLTAVGNTVVVDPAAAVLGNARLSGASVSLAAPVTGSVLVAAENATLGGTIAGDLEFFGNKLEFGPSAKISGIVRVHAPEPITLPAGVADPARVQYEQLRSSDYTGQAGKTAQNVVIGIWPAIFATGIWWFSLAVLGALAIALMPRATENFERRAATHPLATLGLGVLGFSATAGLLPVAALSIVGLILVPFIGIGAIAACIFAYLAGVYLIAMRASRSFFTINTALKRVGVMLVGVVLAGLIGTLPFIGWLISLALMSFGFGIFVRSLFERYTAAPTERIQRGISPEVA
ncbi:hypothetical protein IC608_02845 [Devosia sp. PTR5]|uniref:Polymer-forming cytoskeletal protein n=1 Tax=Devosia oryzisoli TaxID=2774138 RepID=A0A927IS58_9HYPH|nr:hypothetical protein [Devosia oryzisoli]MBD8064413.1 hypothetical protein [Devosia oryzisoli]